MFSRTSGIGFIEVSKQLLHVTTVRPSTSLISIMHIILNCLRWYPHSLIQLILSTYVNSLVKGILHKILSDVGKTEFEITNSMEQNPWESDSKLRYQEIPSLYGTRRFITMFTSLPSVPILNHMNPIHAIPTCFLNINFNIILSSTLRSYEWYLPFRPSRNRCC
jgi:hypothetical protein